MHPGRALLLATSLTGCGNDSSLGWTRVEIEGANGLHVERAVGIGDEGWAFGTKFDDGRKRVLHLDSEGWAYEGDSAELGGEWLIAASPGDSLRSFTQAFALDYLSDLAERGPVLDVWGRDQDDAWAIATDEEDPSTMRVFHLEFEWRVVESLLAFGELQFERGCDDGAGRRWIGAESPDGPVLVHGTGPEWSILLLGDETERLRSLACAPGATWAAVGASSDRLVQVDPDGALETIELEGDGTVRLASMWLEAAGDGWVVGALDGVPMAWRVSGTDGMSSPLGDLELPEVPALTADDYPVLRAVWRTASRRVFVFGVDGLVLEHHE